VALAMWPDPYRKRIHEKGISFHCGSTKCSYMAVLGEGCKNIQKVSVMDWPIFLLFVLKTYNRLGNLKPKQFKLLLTRQSLLISQSIC
jgi:hypothetical protein